MPMNFGGVSPTESISNTTYIIIQNSSATNIISKNLANTGVVVKKTGAIALRPTRGMIYPRYLI